LATLELDPLFRRIRWNQYAPPVPNGREAAFMDHFINAGSAAPEKLADFRHSQEEGHFLVIRWL